MRKNKKNARIIIDAKQYITEKVIQLSVLAMAVIVGTVFFVYHGLPNGYLFIFEISLLRFFLKSGKRILVLPLDLLHGCIEKDVYFSVISDIGCYVFRIEKYCCQWRFRCSDNNTLTLVVPVCLPEDGIFAMDHPEIEQKVRVRYYEYSKILHSWEVI